MKIFLFALPVALFLTVVVHVTAAAPDSLILNEVMPNPVGSDAEGEWIELYFTGTETVSLAEWSLNGSQLPEFDITPASYIILARNVSSVQDILTTEALVVPADFSLPNSGASIELLHESGIISSFTYPQAIEGKSFELRCDEVILSQSHTLGSANQSCTDSEEPPQNTLTSIIGLYISSAMPNPAEGREWLELTNSAPTTIDLRLLKISDLSGKTEPLEGELESGGTIRIIPSSVSLNNNGDSIYLLNGDAVIDTFVYGAVNKGQLVSGSSAELSTDGASGPSDSDTASKQPTPGLAITEPVIVEPTYAPLGYYPLTQ